MTQTGEEFFTALMYGSGAWISLLLIVGIMFLVALKVRFSGVFLIPFSCFLIIMYWDNVGVSDLFMWSTFLLFLSMIVILVIEVKR